jgi:aspartate kinase
VELGAREIRTRRDVAKVSLVGVGVEDTPGLAARAFAVLAQAGIPIEMVTTSQIRITCLVPQSRMEDAVHLLHHAFHLGAGDPPPELAALGNGQIAGLEARPEVTLWNG